MLYDGLFITPPATVLEVLVVAGVVLVVVVVLVVGLVSVGGAACSGTARRGVRARCHAGCASSRGLRALSWPARGHPTLISKGEDGIRKE